MPRFLTLYIQNKRIDEEFKRYERSMLIQAWSIRPELSKKGVDKGDIIYWVTVRQGVLYLIMAMIVGERIHYEDFAQRFGRDLADWDKGNSEFFYVASKGTTIETYKEVDSTDVKKIKDIYGRGLVFNPPQSKFLDPQTLRSPRWISEESADILNKYLEFVDVTPQHILAWRTMIPK
ncbi:MAG: hypothetical protein KBE27_03335 [Syntrophorhabdaceae bacterium]|nr:hypothetical protein [Syntrophorhabdaceae bacterium]